MTWFVLFALGLAVGSFLNVASLRYDPERGLFRSGWLTGRSHCPYCGHTLTAWELIPVLSYVLQWGKCRSCGHRLSLQYPAVELITAVLFVALHLALFEHYGVRGASLTGGSIAWYYPLLSLWLAAAAVLVLITFIDLRLSIIPDAANLTIGILGIAITAIVMGNALADPVSSSFLGHYAMLFGMRENLWWNRLFAAGLGALLFALIVAVTRGRGMGIGDVKLAAALGFLLGWPDAIMGLAIAFIIGAFAGLALMVQRKKGFKDAIPFGPFIVLGAFITLFFGEAIVRGYFFLFPSL